MSRSLYLLMIPFFIMIQFLGGCNGESFIKTPSIPIVEEKEPKESSTVSKPIHEGLALVIANSDYQAGEKLSYTINNAKKIKEVLEKLCFDVTLKTDLSDKYAMDDAIYDFTERLKTEKTRKGIGLFYFVGHGALLENEGPFLLPTNNTNIRQQSDLKSEAVGVKKILGRMKIENINSVVILDACYANPYSGYDTRNLCDNVSIAEIASRVSSLEGGLIKGGFFVAFPNRGSAVSQNGLYTNTLAKKLTAARTREGLTIDKIFGDVRNHMGKVPYHLSTAGVRVVFGGEQCFVEKVPVHNPEPTINIGPTGVDF